MIRCHECDKEFPDDTPRITCDNCNARLEKPAGNTVPALPPVSGEDWSRPADFTTRDGSRSSGSRLRAPSPVVGVEEPEPEGFEDDESEQLDPDHLDTITAFGRKRSIVTVIGFSMSGKTFFVNRLRERLARRSWKRTPRPADEIRVSPEGLELTRLVPPEQKQSQSYVLVDCAGESFSQAMRTQGFTDSLEGRAARSYLTALAFASAYILVIRAEDLALLSEPEKGLSQQDREHRKFIKDVVTGFDEIIHAIVVAQDRLKSQIPEDFRLQGISQEELSLAFDRPSRCRQPICIAFSQADRLEHLPKHGGNGYDADPFLFALKYAPTLFKAVHRTFEHYRFEFLSAFHGHVDQDETLETADTPGINERPDYRMPSYGAVETWEWIHRLIEPGSLWSRPLHTLRGDLPTRYAVELRRRFDPVFRREWGN